MWITFLLKLLTWYPYYVLFGFLRDDVKGYIPQVAHSNANKVFDVLEKPLRFASAGLWFSFMPYLRQFSSLRWRPYGL